MPVPTRLRSRRPALTRAPASVEKPPPSVNSPVAFSSTRVLMIALSGALPGCGVTWTELK